MSSDGDSDRSHDHLRVSQSSKTIKKKAKRPIYPKDILGQFSSRSEQCSNGTHIHVAPFGTGDSLAYHSQYRQPRGTSSFSQFLPPLRHSYLPTQMMPRPQLLASNRVSSSLVATPDEEQGTHELAAGQRDNFGRVMIEPDGASWHPSKDAFRALKESVRRFYTEPYHSWLVIPERIREAMFNEFKTMCTWKPKYNMVIATTFERKASAKLSSWLKKAQNTKTHDTLLLSNVCEELSRNRNTDECKFLSEQVKKAKSSFRGGSLHIRDATSDGTITRKMKKATERTPLHNEIFKRTRVKKKLNESNRDKWVKEKAEQTYYEEQLLEMDNHVQLMPEESTQLWNKNMIGGTHKGRIYGMNSWNDVRRLQPHLEGTESSRQGQSLNGVYIAAMEQQIAQLTHAMAEVEAKEVVSQERMRNNLEQLKEQVLNLASWPTASDFSRGSTPTEDIESNEEDE